MNATSASSSSALWPLALIGGVVGGGWWLLRSKRADAKTRPNDDLATGASTGPDLSSPPSVPSSSPTPTAVDITPFLPGTPWHVPAEVLTALAPSAPSIPRPAIAAPAIAAPPIATPAITTPPQTAANFTVADPWPLPDSFIDGPPHAPPTSPRPTTTATAATALPPPGWVWPIPTWHGRAPVISDGFGSPRDGGSRRHLGADLMYRRRTRTELVTEFPPRSPHSLWHFVPPETIVMAAADGVIWSAGNTPRGYSVVLSHTAPWATYYTHMSRLFVPTTSRGAGGHRVRAGQPLGIVGSDPKNPQIRHLHFEIWHRGTHKDAIDPAPILHGLPVLAPPPMPAKVPAPLIGSDVPIGNDIPIDQIFAVHGRGIPVPYLHALGYAESRLTRNHPQGVLNIVKVALDDYNQRHPAATFATEQLRDPIVSVTVAADILRRIIDSYRTNHPDVANLREDWRNPRFVELVTAGWNAGYSERGGVGRVVDYLRARSIPVDVTNVFRYAPAAGAALTFGNPAKLVFAVSVAGHYARLAAEAV